MDLIILGALIIITIIFFRRFSNVIYVICIIDIFLRIVTKVDSMLNIKTLSKIVDKYIPGSILSIINDYSSGMLNTILVWIYIGIYIIFLIYIIKIFFKRKK